MKLAYYPGCSAQGSSLDYELSTQAVLRKLGIRMEPIPDWNCCGSTPAHAVSTELSSALCARNLDIAARQGADYVVTPCPSCLSNLRATSARLADPKMRGAIDALLDKPCAPTVPESISVLQAIERFCSPEDLAQQAKRSLKGLRLVAYYGCLMSRPHERMQFEDPENPMLIERLLSALGAEMLDFPLKTACCGAAFGIPERPMTAKNSGRILELAKNMGADAIVVCCPLCQMNLDLRQKQAASAMKMRFSMPVPYYSQLIGLALGLSPEELGFAKLIVPAKKLIEHVVTGPMTGGTQ
ncbi:MAG: CoB--CoM heterodisulfide reductase iron-sulfur subunit B family protein [Desulfovibrionaceae bacterium]|nr:CoB--CoM heterodisulfide reductase iron-sulfur subunit B family protein [Desulfovibrionaceae bacterium]